MKTFLLTGLIVGLTLSYYPTTTYASEGMFRNSGDTFGMSFAQETRNVSTINGAGFAYWISTILGESSGRVTECIKRCRCNCRQRIAQDTTRVLSSGDKMRLDAILKAKEGVLVAD